MDASRTLAITRKSLGQIGNDRRTLVVILLVPLVLILVFGYGFGGTPTHIATAYVNFDQGPEGGALLDALSTDTLDLHQVNGAQTAYDEVHDGTVWAAIVIGPAFSNDLRTGNATITVYLDGSSPTIVQAVVGALQSAIQQVFSQSAVKAPIAVAPSYVYGSNGQP